MVNILFQLDNQQRKHLGLVPVEPHWELVELHGSYVYFDGDIIRKKISINEQGYYECELNELTSSNRTILEPKTTRGKPKKLNYTSTLSFSPFATYFKIDSESVRIANYTTQITYYDEKFEAKQSIQDWREWIDQWINESFPQDLNDLDAFKNAKRIHQKFKEGDFFAFKIGRRQWGFGRILVDVAQLKKDKKFLANKNYGLTNLMAKPLIVKVYHHVATHKEIDLHTLENCAALPAQAIMDNNFFICNIQY